MGFSFSRTEIFSTEIELDWISVEKPGGVLEVLEAAGDKLRVAQGRQIWHPHWKRVEAEDAEMKISEWVSRKRKLMWMARFGTEIAKHNALMISRSQNIADCE